MEGLRKAEAKVVTVLTIMTTFLMGFIDAYTFMEKSGVFVTAQTGNMVVFSVKLFTGNWAAAGGHVTVFAGFALGAFVAQGVIERYSEHGLTRYRYFLLLQAFLLFVLALFQHSMGNSLMVFCLGLLAGYELTVFRKIGSTAVNNGIMTGNAKNAMNNLYKAVFNKDAEAKREFFNLVSGLSMFVIGAGTGAWVVKLNPHYSLWASFSLVTVSVLWLFYTESRIRHHARQRE